METRKEIRKALVILTSPLIIIFGGTVLAFLLFKEMIEELIQDRKKPVYEPEPEHNPNVIRRETARVQTDEVKSTAENDKSLLNGVEHIREYQIKLNRKLSFSTHYALMVECFERILIDILNDTTKEDTIVIHQGIYLRLKTNCKRMEEPNIITYTEDDYTEAFNFMTTISYYMNKKSFKESPESFFNGHKPIVLLNTKYKPNNEGVEIFEDPHHDKYEERFKMILNEKGINVDYSDFLQNYYWYFIGNYKTFKSPKSRHAIGISQKATTFETLKLCESTLQALHRSLESGIDLNFLIPALVGFLEEPTTEIINELVTRKPCELPWIVDNKHNVKKACFHSRFDGKFSSLSDGIHSLFVLTERHIIHFQNGYYDNSGDYIDGFFNFYNADGSTILLMGIEIEANADGLDILAMFCENMTTIESFDYEEKELKKAHLNCVIDAENLLFRINGHTLDRLHWRNLKNYNY
ncbi:hypothetical protein RZM80_005709 [Pseudomonas aeruginosa]|nr:hypothetical protein [Pseudomonas aeruginosa]ELP1438593.1 hypothetical protein [Pseudomonas aeruginosa]